MWMLVAAALADPGSAVRAHTGRPVAVVVAKGSWCPVCVAELRRLDAQRSTLDAMGATVIGVFAEDPATLGRLGLDLPLAADEDGAWVRANGFTRPGVSHPLPGVLFYDRCGDPVARIGGRSPGVPQAPAILSTLRELAAGPPCEAVPNS